MFYINLSLSLFLSLSLSPPPPSLSATFFSSFECAFYFSLLSGSGDELFTPKAKESLYTGATMTTEAAWRAIIDFQVSHKLTYSALNDLLLLVKSLCPAPNNCPRSTYLLKKHFEYVTDVNSIHFVHPVNKRLRENFVTN